MVLIYWPFLFSLPLHDPTLSKKKIYRRKIFGQFLCCVAAVTVSHWTNQSGKAKLFSGIFFLEARAA
jgi:hypothetical protein